MYHFFIAKMSQWAISLESTADIQYRGFFSPSLKQYEHSFCSSERSHPLNMGRSPHCVCVCVRVHVSVNALESFQSWVDVLGMVLSHTNSCVTSSFLSLLRRHGDSDSNAGKTLRLCYVLCYCFFFSTWPRCCSSSVYVNSCHTKKSHINSERHNKLLLRDSWTFLYYHFFVLKMM